MMVNYNTPPRPDCQVCRVRPAQGIVASAETSTVRHIPVCGECLVNQRDTEVRLWMRSLALVIGGWPR